MSVHDEDGVCTVAIFGLGYVGVVSAAMLTASGHRVVGVEPNSSKVAAINDGSSPITEPEVDGLIRAASKMRLLRATDEAADALVDANYVVVCVGTPSTKIGTPDLSAISKVADAIGRYSNRETLRAVIVRSTVPPGTTRGLILDPLVERGFTTEVVFQPEFLREGTAVADYRDPSLIVIGRSSDATSELRLPTLPPGCESHYVQLEDAELLKYVANSWHATKIAFANEVGEICNTYGVDPYSLMAMLMKDSRLNASAAYTRPGGPFGGSCLPKDLRALEGFADDKRLALPLLASVRRSNDLHLQRILDSLDVVSGRKYLLLGLTFKPDTDDVRESPMVEVAEYLVGKGATVKIIDPSFSIPRSTGRNRSYALEHLPHLADLLVSDLSGLTDWPDVAVVGPSGTHLRGQLASDIPTVEVNRPWRR